MAIDDMPMKLVKVDLAPLKLFALGVLIFSFLAWGGGLEGIRVVSLN